MKYGICNAKAKVEGGGGATLNLAYGLTPPEDTTKIWVKCNEPISVKVEANRQLVVSSNENAKVLTETAIAKTNVGYGNYYNPNPKMVKIGSDYYMIAGMGNDACYMNDYQITKWKVYKMTSAGVVSELCDVNSWISTSYAQMYGLFKYDDTHLLLVAGNSNQSSRMFLFLIDITTTNSFVGHTITNTTLGTNMCFDGNVVYGMKYNYSDNTKVQIFTYSLNNTTSTILLDMPTGYVRAYNTNNSPIVYNGAVYFIVNTSSTEVKLMKWVINSNEISVYMDLPKIKINDTDYNLNYATPHLFGNKIIYTNISNDFNNSAPTGTDLYNGV